MIQLNPYIKKKYETVYQPNSISQNLRNTYTNIVTWAVAKLFFLFPHLTFA